MSIVPPIAGRGNPGPNTCPVCGLTTDNADVTHGQGSSSATYVCSDGHLFVLMWEVSS